MRTARLISILAAALLGLAVWVPPASAAPQGPWIQPPSDLSASGQDAELPQIATAPDGTTTVVWWRFDAPDNIIQAATRAPGAVGFSAPVNLSAGGGIVYEPQVTSAPDGTTTAIWRLYDGIDSIIQAATRAPGALSFSAPVNLSAGGGDAGNAEITTAPDGTTTAVWLRRPFIGAPERIIQTATRPPGGSFGAPVDLSAVGQSANLPQITTAPDGTTTAVWERFDGSSNYIIQAATRPPGGSFGAPIGVSAAGEDAEFAQIATAPDGTTTVVWKRYDGANHAIRAATRAPGAASFSTPVTLAATGRGPVRPQVATSPDGTTTVIWWRIDGSGNTIQAATRVPGAASFSTPVNLSASGRDAGNPQITAAPDGTTTAVWHRSNGRNSVIQVSTRPPGGSFGAPVRLSATGRNAGDPQITTAPDGVATAVWHRFNGRNQIIQSTYTGPLVLALEVAKKLKVKPGRKVKFKVTVKNFGGAKANNAKLCLQLSKKLKKRLKPKGKKCKKLGSLAPGQAKKKNFKLKATKRAKKGKKYKVIFKLSADNADPTSRSVKVKAR